MEAAETLNPFVFDRSLLSEYENVSIAIYGFSDELVRITEPTRDGRLLMRGLSAVLAQPRRGTPLFSHIAETVRQAAATKGEATRMIVVFSDGLSSDPEDVRRYADVVRASQESGVAVYPVQLTGSIPNETPITSSRGKAAVPMPGLEVNSLRSYAALAEATGGEAFHEVRARDALPRILTSISKRLRYDYVAGYYPSSPGSTKRRSVAVKWRSASKGQIIGGTRALSQ